MLYVNFISINLGKKRKEITEENKCKVKTELSVLTVL